MSGSEESGRLLRNALEDLEKSYGSGHEKVAYGLMVQAQHDIKQGNFKPVIGLLERSRSILESTLGKRTWRYVELLQVYLDLYKEQGQFGEAESVLRQLISLSTAEYRENFHFRRSPPPLYRLHHQLAEVCKAQGKIDEARKHGEEVARLVKNATVKTAEVKKYAKLYKG